MRLLFVFFFITVNFFSFSQTNQNYSQDDLSSRLVVSPIFNPVKSYSFLYRAFDNSKIENSINEHTVIGLRTERYSPLKRLDYGIDLTFKHKNESFFVPEEIQLDENQIGLRPIITFKNNLEVTDINHWFISLGITSNYTFSHSFQKKIGTYVEPLNDSPIRKFRMSSFLEIGLKKDVFYNSKWNYLDRSGVTNLSASFELPFFNQSYLFNFKEDSYAQDFLPFVKSRTIPFGFQINYTQLIDVRKNEMINPYRDSTSLVNSTDRWRFLPPIKNWLEPHSKTSGSFYLQTIYNHSLDSVFVQNSSSDTLIFNRSQSSSFSFGYNLHLFSTNSDLINSNGNSSVFRDIYIGLGLSNRMYSLKKSDLAKIEFYNMELKAGIRFGFGNCYLTGGYKRLIPIKKRFHQNGKSEPFSNFSNLSNNIGYIGIGVKNNVYFILNYRTIEPLKKVENSIFNNLEYTIGIGI